MRYTTDKTECGGYAVRYDLDYAEAVVDIVQKMGALEDKEKRLGMDLLTFLDAVVFKSNIYLWLGLDKFPYYDGITAYDGPRSVNRGLNDKRGYYLETSCGNFYLSEYGKTWALRKGDLAPRKVQYDDVFKIYKCLMGITHVKYGEGTYNRGKIWGYQNAIRSTCLDSVMENDVQELYDNRGNLRKIIAGLKAKGYRVLNVPKEDKDE